MTKQKKYISKKPIVVLYHADCTDGFTAAWVAYKKFGKKAQYIQRFHDDEPPKLRNKEIYMVDISFPSKEILEHLISTNHRVTIIDHHVSRKDVTLMSHKPSYSDIHSGATLAWQYFFPNKPAPRFLLHVEEGDLWKYKRKGTREILAYLGICDKNFATWSKVVKDIENPKKREGVIQKGKILLQYDMKTTKHNIGKNAMLVRFAGHTVYAINTNYSITNTGHILYKKHPPFAITWYQKSNGTIKVGLRGDGTVDCARIAAEYDPNGGGHRNSAGFFVKSPKDIPWKKV